MLFVIVPESKRKLPWTAANTNNLNRVNSDPRLGRFLPGLLWLLE
jgi:hypothetical protein